MVGRQITLFLYMPQERKSRICRDGAVPASTPSRLLRRRLVITIDEVEMGIGGTLRTTVGTLPRLASAPACLS